ncbi:hypothetical protein PLICRDRAFT_40022 [Plicaturopsis crispa FD-325 SS-3]|nr:hypothetical protein PLICRDRAFT_40022 [Plicaturopsis crispa FD-325 SS-3]
MSLVRTDAVLSVAAVAVAFLVFKILRAGRRESFLPPGPPTVPLLGNLHVLPTTFAHYKFTEWAAEYGDIYSLKVASGTALVISSAKAVKELMDRNTGNSVDRPPLYWADQITGGLHLATVRYGDIWRSMRKTAHTILTPQGADRHLPIQQAETTQLLYDLLHTPEDFFKHLRRFSNSGILSVLYGTRSPRYESKDSKEFFDVEHRWEGAGATGHSPPIDLVPILKYIPERWAPWKEEWREVRRLQGGFYRRMYADMEAAVERGEEVGAFMEEVVKRREEFGLTREVGAYLGGTLIEGGSDTTTSFLQTMIMAIIKNPDVQRKAHEELDRVVGSKVPTIADYPELKYIHAIIKEVHRWRPVIPVVLPHMTIAEDHYRGYHIPKNTTIFMNTWGVYHDPEAFDNPDVFNPDRYLQAEFGTKPGVDERYWRHTFSFGCGRRICPGIHVADNAIMIAIMLVLWAFEFDYAIDPETRKPIELDEWDFHDGTFSYPNPYKCSIKPRSAHHAELIEQVFVDSIPTLLPFERKLDAEEKAWVAQSRAHLKL